MENTVQPQPRIFTVAFGHFTEGTPAIALMVNPSAFLETADGPLSGAMLTPAQARELAYVLLLYAEQLAGGLVNIPEKPKP